MTSRNAYKMLLRVSLLHYNGDRYWLKQADRWQLRWPLVGQGFRTLGRTFCQ